MPIGRLQTEGDLERFIENQTTQALTGLRAQTAGLTQGQNDMTSGAVFVTGEATASGTLVGLATNQPVATVPRTASYLVLFGAQFTAASAVTPAVSLTINGVVSLIPEHAQTLSTGTGSAQISTFTFLALTEGDVVGLAYRSQAAIAVTFSNRRLALVRLSS